MKYIILISTDNGDHSSVAILNYNSTSFTQTTAIHKTKYLLEFTTTSVVPKIMTSIKSLIITSSQTASFTQSTSSTNSNVKSEKRPSITPHFTTLSSIDSTISMSINSINTHNYKQQSQIRISSTTVAATIIIPQSTFNISSSTFDSTQSTFNIVQSITDTNQRSAGTNTSTIITISVTIVVLSIILILIIIIVIFSMVMIVKRRQKYNLGNNIIFIFV